MTIDDISLLNSEINSDGLDYAMIFYSRWEEIDDQKFHKLRKKYIKIRKKLVEQIKELELKVDNENME